MKTTGKFSKKDFLIMYDGVKIHVFEFWIEDIIEEIKWVKGKKQVFPPSVARRIFDHIGLPTHLELLDD